MRFATPELLGGPPGLIGRAELADAVDRVRREIDLVVLAPGERPGADATVQCIGEVTLSAGLDASGHLDRCAELIRSVARNGVRKLVIAEDFSSQLVTAAEHRADVELVGLPALYGL